MSVTPIIIPHKTNKTRRVLCYARPWIPQMPVSPRRITVSVRLSRSLSRLHPRHSYGAASSHKRHSSTTTTKTIHRIRHRHRHRHQQHHHATRRQPRRRRTPPAHTRTSGGSRSRRAGGAGPARARGCSASRTSARGSRSCCTIKMRARCASRASGGTRSWRGHSRSQAGRACCGSRSR